MRIPKLPARPWVVTTAVVAAAPSGGVFFAAPAPKRCGGNTMNK